jgi:hypothetical protein
MYKNQPRLVRSIPGGFGVLVKAVASGLGVRDDQARQFILKFGLDTQQIEGQVFKILNIMENLKLLRKKQLIRVIITLELVQVLKLLLMSGEVRIPIYIKLMREHIMYGLNVMNQLTIMLLNHTM